ncbi:Serine/threonine-protein kinase env7 [Xanthoria calcicola]
MAEIFMDLLSSLTNCLFCFPGSPQLKVNNRSFKLLRLLGEGGFSYVYLVQDTSTSQLYALKKIRCPFGQESVSLALKEAEAYALFSPHPHIIHAVDHAVTSANDKSDPGSKTVYILLPYYRRGNLQDAINANLVNHTQFPERRLMILFLGVAKALKAMHRYRVKGAPGGPQSRQNAKKLRQEAEEADKDAARKARSRRKDADISEEEDIEQEPLMNGEVTRSQEGVEDGEMRAYAHRDVKPGNIMISDSGTSPILMDLGSLAPSPVHITSRALALQTQDLAAEHSTLPYRAPELFDTKTGAVIDAKTDIWSFGCTLFACLVGKSPFEMRSEETGGSLSICVLGGDWRFPDEESIANGGGRRKAKKKGKGKGREGDGERGVVVEENDDGDDGDGGISEGVRGVVRACLRVESAERPDVDEVIGMIEKVVAELPPDDGDGVGGEESEG